MLLSWQYDLQTGPSIVVMAAAWLLLSLGLNKLKAS
jgi:ABC-type Mn2+/Zn2+ transport system permease subunit